MCTGYLMSPRQTLGALLAESGEYARAAAVYEADLQIFPKNVWSLAGLKLCLSKSDSKPADTARLRAVEAEYAVAASKADVKVRASCACAVRSWAA